MIENKINQLLTEASRRIKSSLSLDELEKWVEEYTRRKGEFNLLLKSIGEITDAEERKKIGQAANAAKTKIQKWIIEKERELEVSPGTEEEIDVTLPGKKIASGNLHPLSLVRYQIEDIFSQLGFEIADGPEIENEFYNFDALNIPKDHPARDMQDTFWIKSEIPGPKSSGIGLSMRSQTSAIQARYMQTHKPPFRIIAPGKCFRNEATDATHDHTFYQFEALVVGDKVNVGNLKSLAQIFFSRFFDREIKVRLRPSYFPFTEPSFEFDITCTVCGGKGCKACKYNRWLELGGAGMVNQNVFQAAGYPRNRYQGFAWGFGLERLAMMKYKIDDVRLFHSGDLRFIRQF